jgi:hypothetical protein
MESFNYIPNPIKDKDGNILGQVYRPMIPVRLCYKHKISPFPISCLLDSGSDNNLFPAYFAQNIGIKLNQGKEISITGIGNIEIKAYRHKIKLFVGNKSFITTIDFSHDQQLALLGRNGFFNQFDKVIFKEKEKIIKLSS